MDRGPVALTVRLRGISGLLHDFFVGIDTRFMVQAIDDPGVSPQWIYDLFSVLCRLLLCCYAVFAVFVWCVEEGGFSIQKGSVKAVSPILI